MSLVMPLPSPAAAARYAVSRSSTPGAGQARGSSPTPPTSARIHSRPGTPPQGAAATAAHLAQALHTISAPPTPVNTTHLVLPLALGMGAVSMERCRSSEAVLSHHHNNVPGTHHKHKDKEATPNGTPKATPKGTPKATPKGTPKATPSPHHSALPDENAPPARPVPQAIIVPGPVPVPGPAPVPNDHNVLDIGTSPLSPLPNYLTDRLAERVEEVQESHIDTHPIEPVPPHSDADAVDRADEVEVEERMDIDDIQLPAPELGVPTSDDSAVWGMPKWGLEDERPEVRPGVRLVGMEELPALIERHSLLDTPSQVLFPWLHGISDDGIKGREMGAFFGHSPPFAPPPYRGLTLVLSPPHPMDRDRAPAPANSPTTGMSPLLGRRDLPQEDHLCVPANEPGPSSTGSAASSSSNHLEPSPSTTAESLPPLTPPGDVRKLYGSVTVAEVDDDEQASADVQMHPLVSPRQNTVPMPDAVPDSGSSDSDSYMSEDDTGPSCILMNAVHAQDVFELPMLPLPGRRPSFVRVIGPSGIERPHGRFRPARLPNQINLRNLHIQQIKYATISDIVLYTRHGVSPGTLEIAESIANAQDELYRQRMEEYYSTVDGRGSGEGVDRPVKYGVWVLVEPFSKVEKFCPHLVNIDSEGRQTNNSRLVDLFEREAFESRTMTRATEVIDGFWVGNDTDVPGGADDGAGATVPFDLCVKASECSDMPLTVTLASAYRSLTTLDRMKSEAANSGWVVSPATQALRNLLSPGSGMPTAESSAAHQLGTSPDETSAYAQAHAAQHHYVAIECAGSCRTITGQMRNLSTMTDKVIELVTFLRKLVEGRDKTGIRRKVLVHCQDGYTESSIIVLSYIMAALGCSLPEAYLYLQLEARRSFFLYPTDRPLLHRIEARLAQERRERAAKAAQVANGSATRSSTSSAPTTLASPTSRWKPWGFIRGSAVDDKDKLRDRERERERGERSARGAEVRHLDHGRSATVQAQEARVWFEDRRFDGFPSRILPFLYLGNLEHAGNAAMLKSLGITHVVSVGESLLDVPPEHDPLHGYVGANTLGAAARVGHIQVLDLTDVRDDGNDPLRPLISRACEWMEQARLSGGNVLVHCRVGVSRSASIVMAYLMKYRRMGLMDAYLMTRARRLNVLIQPNLRFFHELFGWEVELARGEAEERARRRADAIASGVRDPNALALLDDEPRVVLYSWPTFCRDVHCLNRRFLCN